MTEMINTYKILGINLEGKRSLTKAKKGIIKLIIMKYGVERVQNWVKLQAIMKTAISLSVS
jgi:hypothetical protein